MKNKNTAAALALILGIFGVHRFYLNRPGQGILYCMLFFTGISAILGVIDAVLFWVMDPQEFDYKYNRLSREEDGRRFESRGRGYADYDRRRPRGTDTWQPEHKRRPPYTPSPSDMKNTSPAVAKKENAFKASGIKKYKDFDVRGAIEDFKKSLAIEPNDVPTYFNLACAYSINEQAADAFEYLGRAVQMGFSDFDKIKTHDGLAFLRIQPEYEDFVANGYRLLPEVSAGEDATPLDISQPQNDLLEQIKQLGNLREQGLITDDDFALQTKKLLA